MKNSDIIFILTLPVLQAKADTFTNSVDLDENAHIEPSHQDLHCLQSDFNFF